MAQSFDRCENAMLGHALADSYRGSTYMSLSLSKSLRKLEKFDSPDVMSRYLHIRYHSDGPMGGATNLVHDELKEKRIYSASRSAHDKLKGLSGGCKSAQRSFPLALCPWINDENLFQAGCDETRLTRFSATAGQVSDIINLICRYLLKGDDWNVAVSTAFSTATNLSGEIQNRDEHDTVLNSQGHPAIHYTLLCIVLQILIHLKVH